jgi:hypothetical protein
MIDPSRSQCRRVGAVALAAMFLLVSASTGWAANPAATTAPQVAPALTEGVVAAQPAELKVANRSIVTLRTGFFGASAADRVEAIEERIGSLVARGGPMEVSTHAIEGGYAVLLDGDLVCWMQTWMPKWARPQRRRPRAPASGCNKHCWRSVRPATPGRSSSPWSLR